MTTREGIEKALKAEIDEVWRCISHRVSIHESRLAINALIAATLTDLRDEMCDVFQTNGYLDQHVRHGAVSRIQRRLAELSDSAPSATAATTPAAVEAHLVTGLPCPAERGGVRCRSYAGHLGLHDYPDATPLREGRQNEPRMCGICGKTTSEGCTNVVCPHPAEPTTTVQEAHEAVRVLRQEVLDSSLLVAVHLKSRLEDVVDALIAAVSREAQQEAKDNAARMMPLQLEILNDRMKKADQRAVAAEASLSEMHANHPEARCSDMFPKLQAQLSDAQKANTRLRSALRDLIDAIPDATFAADPPLKAWAEIAESSLTDQEPR